MKVSTYNQKKGSIINYHTTKRIYLKFAEYHISSSWQAICLGAKIE